MLPRIPVVPGDADVERQAFKKLKECAYDELAPVHGLITRMSSLLAKVPDDTASKRFPAHLDLQLFTSTADDNTANWREARIELPEKHQIRPFLNYDGWNGLAGMLNLPWSKDLPYCSGGSSPALEEGLRTSYAVVTDVPGPWKGQEKNHTLLLHVDHVDNVARAVTLVDLTTETIPASVLFDTSERLSGHAVTHGALTDEDEVNSAIAHWVPRWVSSVLDASRPLSQAGLNTLKEIAEGPHRALLAEALAGQREKMGNIMAAGKRFGGLDDLDKRLAKQSPAWPEMLADFVDSLRTQV